MKRFIPFPILILIIKGKEAFKEIYSYIKIRKYEKFLESDEWKKMMEFKRIIEGPSIQETILKPTDIIPDRYADLKNLSPEDIEEIKQYGESMKSLQKSN